MTAKLRPTHVADIFRLQEIERAAAELFRGSDLIDIDTMAAVAMGDHIVSIDEGMSLVGEADGRIAGFVIGEMHDDAAYLRELDVDPEFQQRGIGAKLVRMFADTAKAKGAKCVYLSTFRTPPWNAPFYRKLGFKDVSRADYRPWMSAIEIEQAAFLDMETRVFMRLD